MVVLGLSRTGRAHLAPAAVASFIGAAYLFTSSTGFANPAVTIGRAFTDTFAGIAPGSVLPFIAAQLAGTVAGIALVALCFGQPDRAAEDVAAVCEGRTLSAARPLTIPPHPAPDREEPAVSTPVRSVLFVCVHNAGRSQMAAVFLAHLAGDAVEVRSAGSTPADEVNPAVVEAMREAGIDISAETPKVLTPEAVQSSDVVITMGCGDTCPVFPGKQYLDWELDDPAGQGVDAVRPIRDDIKQRVRGLLARLLPEA